MHMCLDFLEFRVWNIERQLIAGQLFAPDSEIGNDWNMGISGITMKQRYIALETRRAPSELGHGGNKNHHGELRRA